MGITVEDLCPNKQMECYLMCFHPFSRSRYTLIAKKVPIKTVCLDIVLLVFVILFS